MTIYSQLQKIQNGEREPLINLITKFYPLLKKYAIKLDYDDAFEDLQTKLIELLRSIALNPEEYRDDKFFLSYIKTSIYRYSIQLMHEKIHRQKEIPASGLRTDDGDEGLFPHKWDKLTSVSDDYVGIQLDFLYRTLTKYEAEIIIYHFYQQYPIKEIARFYGVSSPAISRAKKNALKKLRENITL